MIEATKVKLAAIWISLMLTYLLGDVLRIFSGDFAAGEISGMEATQAVYLAVAVVLLIPILMITFSLNAGYRLNRTLNIVAALLLFGFNLIGLPTYPSVYDQFLIVIGLLFNLLTIWTAWSWRTERA